MYHVNLDRFAALMKTNETTLPSVDGIRDPAGLNQYVATTLTGLFEKAIKASGHYPRQGQRNAPWWTEECAAERQRWLNDDSTAEGRKRFQNAVRQAKRKYRSKVINEVKEICTASLRGTNSGHA